MLQAIREKTSGWIAYVIIGLISIPFALWGINSYLGGGEQQPAAIVDGDEITVRDLDYAYARYRERLSSVFGGQLPDMFNDEITLKEQVLSQMIEEQALQNYIQQRGIYVGDAELFGLIRTMPAFQQDGKFSKELYQNQLASQGYNPSLFEFELRRSQQMAQLNRGIKSSAFTLPVQRALYDGLRNQARKLRTVTIENQVDSISVSDQEIEEFYQQQPARFMQPAQVKVDYIELSMDNIKQSIQIDEDRLMERYEQLRDQLTTPEFRLASHILLTVQDAENEEQVRQKIEQLKQRIEQGEDFAQLAREFSQDPGSAADGGDLGEVERGMMVKPFETALFDLTVGEISEPVKTQFGWHLIKLHAVSGGDTQSFEQARPDIEEELKTDMAESQVYDLTENLANIAYEQPDSLLPAAEQLGLTIQTSDWFTRTQGEGLAQQEKVRQVAFSDEVLNQNRNSETLELANNRIIIMHLNSHRPAARKELETVRDEIIQLVKIKKGREQTQSEGQKLLAELQSGKSLDDIAAAESKSVVDLGFVKRDNQVLDRDVLSAAFTMSKPTQGSLVYEGITEVDGDYTLIELSAIESATEAANTGDDQQPSPLNDAIANYDYQAMTKVLAEQADVIRTPVAELQ